MFIDFHNQTNTDYIYIVMVMTVLKMAVLMVLGLLGCRLSVTVVSITIMVAFFRIETHLS